MPLIELGHAVWNTVPTQNGSLARARLGGAGPSRHQEAIFAHRVVDEIQSAKDRDLTAGVSPAELLVLLRTENQETAQRHQSPRPTINAQDGCELTRLTGPPDLRGLMSRAAADDQILFLICGNVASSQRGSADAGYAATLLRAGALANAIVSAAIVAGWSASMDFAPQYAVTAAVRQADPLATHLGTVRVCPGDDHE